MLSLSMNADTLFNVLNGVVMLLSVYAFYQASTYDAKFRRKR